MLPHEPVHFLHTMKSGFLGVPESEALARSGSLQLTGLRIVSPAKIACGQKSLTSAQLLAILQPMGAAVRTAAAL